MRKSIVAVAFAALLVSAGSTKVEEQRAIQDDLALITQVAILNSIQTAQEVLKLTAGVSTSVISTSQDLIKNAQGTLNEVAGILAQAGGGASSRFTPQIMSQIINNFFQLAQTENALAQALLPIIIEAQIKNTNVLFDLVSKSAGNIDSTVQEVVTNVQGNLQAILSAASAQSRQGGPGALIVQAQQMIATNFQMQQAAIGNAVAMIQTFWAALGGGAQVEALNDLTIISSAQSAKAVLGLVKATSSDIDDAAQAIIGNIQEAIQKVAGVLAAAAAPASRGLLDTTQQAANDIFAQIMGNTALVQALAPPLIANAISTSSSLLTLSGDIISQVDDATGAIVDNTNANLDAIIAGVQA